MTRLSASTRAGKSCKSNSCSVGSKSLKNFRHKISMTDAELTRASAASDASFCDNISSDDGQPNRVTSNGSRSHVRFSLRKRPASDDPGVVMSSYNSAFMSGLFADIANANEESDARLDEGVSVKKSRISLNRSISRCSRSYHTLADVVSPEKPSAPPVTNEPDSVSEDGLTLCREDSLLDQLHCVSSSSSNESDSKMMTTDFGKLVFPHLPAAVSDQDLTQMLQCRQSSETLKESYGWFVEMDLDNVSYVSQDSYVQPPCKDDLAFSATTAPKTTEDDAQVEWAKAADTVDDVLGDFF